MGFVSFMEIACINPLVVARAQIRNAIKGGILFVAAAIAQRLLDRFFDWSEGSLLHPILGMSF